MDNFLNDVLIEAAKDGNLLVLKTAIDKGADINAKDKNGWTALMWASKNGHSEVVEFLKEKGARLSEMSVEPIVEHKNPEGKPNPNWKIVFGRMGQGLMVMNADGTGLTTLLNWGEMPNVSPDGTKIVFTSSIGFSKQPLPDDEAMYYLNQIDSGYNTTRLPGWILFGGGYAYIKSSPDIYLIDIKENSIKELVSSDERGASFPKFSPDGREIAFKWTQDGKGQIWIVNIDGTNLKQLTFGESVDYFNWRFDGKIIFSDKNDKLFIIDSDGKNLQRLTIFEDDEYEPIWSKVGENIAFLKGKDLYIMNADSGKKQRLTEIQGWIGGWSPDNQWIIFSSRKTGTNGADIFIIRKDGKYETRLTDLFVPNGKIGGDFDPCWLSSI